MRGAIPILLLAAVLTAQTGGELPLFRTGVADVRVDAQVVEGNQVIAGLSQKDFRVFDDEQPQPIVYFGHEAEPLTLLLLLDISGSMQRYLDQLVATSRQTLALLRPGDRVGVMLFGLKTKIAVEFMDNHAEVARRLAEVVRDETVGSGTNINLALMDAAEYLKNQPPFVARMEGQPNGPGRRAVLILTDNLGLNYKRPDGPVITAFYTADAVLNAIVTGKHQRPGPPPEGGYRNPDFTPADVFKICEHTGGETVRSDQAGAAFRQMLERIRTRYSLEYHAPAAKPNTFRWVRVELSSEARSLHPAAEVHARSGYFSHE